MALQVSGGIYSQAAQEADLRGAASASGGGLPRVGGAQGVGDCGGSITYRIAVGPQAGRKVLMLQTRARRRPGASRRGKGREAQDLLATVCDRFTEGFDTSDLKEVKALLDKLESQTTLRPCGCMASQMLATFAFGLCV
jgi:hypothetical protein